MSSTTRCRAPASSILNNIGGGTAPPSIPGLRSPATAGSSCSIPPASRSKAAPRSVLQASMPARCRKTWPISSRTARSRSSPARAPAATTSGTIDISNSGTNMPVIQTIGGGGDIRFAGNGVYIGAGGLYGNVYVVSTGAPTSRRYHRRCRRSDQHQQHDPKFRHHRRKPDPFLHRQRQRYSMSATAARP